MKKFKTKKRFRFIKILLFLVISFFSMYYTFNFCVSNFSKKVDMKKLVKYLIKEGFNNQIIKYEESNLLNIKEPLFLIQSNLNFKYEDIKESEPVKVVQEVNEEIEEPLIYIYNTHDEEKYKYTLNGAYNIIPNVRLVSLILEEKLNDLGIKTISEDESIENILKDNNWSYKDSYQASRMLVKQAKNNYKSLQYFIDIHRDSMNRDVTTLEYNNEIYAKILFVIGKENEDYNNNLELAKTFSNKLNEIIPDISRGISLKEGPGVNGVYNQDLSDNLILIEIGGVDNDIVEVNNSINILTEVLYKYIKENNYAKEKI